MAHLRVLTALLGAILVGVVTLPLPQSHAETASIDAVWWPRGIRHPSQAESEWRQGWNLRVPIEVRNPGPDTAETGMPVQAHLDLGGLLMQGTPWPRTQTAFGPVPKSFTLDFDSIRLVEYKGTWADIQGTSTVPVVAFPIWLEPDQRPAFGRVQGGPFHLQQNTVVTLEWLLPRSLAAARTAHYMVYFEILQNSDKNQDAFSRPDQERLDSLYWIHRGIEFYGFHAGAAGPTLKILGVQDDTLVHVYEYPPGSPTPTLVRGGLGNPSNPFAIDRDQSVGIDLGASAKHFKVVASKPVIVADLSFHSDADGRMLRSSGDFVPSIDGNLRGRTFLVPNVRPGFWILVPFDSSPTQVSITSAADGSPVQGPFPLSVGTRRQIPTGNGDGVVYRVQSTADILVQYVPIPSQDNRVIFSAPTNSVMAQAPSSFGSSLGRVFYVGAIGQFVVETEDGLAHVQFHDVSRDPPPRIVPVSDLCPSSPEFDVCAGPAPAETLVVSTNGFTRTQESTNPDERGRPYRADTEPTRIQVLETPGVPESERNPISIRFGQPGNPVAGQTTPFGGVHGMRISTRGPIAIYPYYPETRVTVTRLTDSHVEQRKVGEGVPFTIPASASVSQTTPMRVESDKPVAVVPFAHPGRYTRFLAAQPGFLQVQPLPGEYRGFLLDLKPLDTGDPPFYEGLPDSAIRIPFRLRNLGLWNNEPLSDVAQLGASIHPPIPGVRVEFAQQEMPLPGQGPLDSFADVMIPPGPESGARFSVTLSAKSKGNENMVSEFAAVVSVGQNFGLRMWFGAGCQGGPESVPPGKLQPSQTQRIPIVLQNTGSGPDTFGVALGGVDAPWQVRLLENHRPLSRLEDLQPLECRALELEVSAPQTGAPITAKIDASSEGGGAAARLLYSARLSLGQALNLSTPLSSALVPPGGEARLRVLATNTGGDPLFLVFALSGLPPGWSGKFEGPGDPKNGSVSLRSGASMDVPIVLRAPANALAGQLGTLLVRADGTGESAGVADAIPFVGIVDARRLLAASAASEVFLEPGVSVPLDVNMTNHGNVVETIRIVPLSFPAGWNLTQAATSTLVPANSSRQVQARIQSAPDALAGEYDLKFASVGDSGAVAMVNVTAHVGPKPGIELPGPSTSRLQPGDTETRVLRMKNSGNSIARLVISVQHPEGWLLELSPSHIDLDPGETGVATLRYTVPTTAEPRPYELTIRVDGGQASTAATTQIHLQVATPILESSEVATIRTGKGVGAVNLVSVSIRNVGLVPARNVALRLLQDAIVVDNVSFAAIGPNGTIVGALEWSEPPVQANMTLEWGFVSDGEFRRIGAQELLAQPSSGSPGTTGAPAVLTVIFALTFALLLGRRHHR